MTEADILAETYEDEVTVYRPFKSTLESGESVFKKRLEGLKVYEHVPCALSTHTGGKLAQSVSTAAVPTEYSLFVRPEISIQPNDFLVVTHLGEREYMIAGKADRHVSHNEIPVKPEKEII